MATPNRLVRRLKAFGRYPKFVYRAFTPRPYAEEFARGGKFRMGNLRVYSSVDDIARADPSEGEGQFQRFGTVTTVDFVPRSDDSFVSQAPGCVHTHTELLNPKFVLSCSLPGVDLDYLRSRFGAWVVRIENPRRLAQELTTYLEGLSDQFSGVEGCVVHYNRGGKVGDRLTNIGWTRLSYSQKAAIYNSEREFRSVVVSMGKPSSWLNRDYLAIDLGRSLDYVTVI